MGDKFNLEDFLKSDEGLAATSQIHVLRPNGRSQQAKENPARDQSAPLILRLPEFLQQFTPPDYLIDKLLLRGFLYSLTGMTGAGKTAVALLMAVLVSMREEGQKLGPYEVKPGRVLYITRENPTDVRMRLIGMASKVGFDPEALEFLVLENITTIDKRSLSRISAEVAAFGDLALVIVDTSFSLFLGDDENSNAQAGNHARQQRKLTELPGRPCVVTLCHPIKNVMGKESLIPRGGGAFLNEVDGNLCLLGHENKISELHWMGKIRGPDFAPVAFRMQTILTTKLLDAKGRMLPTVMAEVVSDEQAEEVERKSQAEEDRLLIAIDEKPDGTYVEWGAACGYSKSQVGRLVDGLRREKLVMKAGRSHKLTKDGKEAAERARKSCAGIPSSQEFSS